MFLPMGSDKETRSDYQLIARTNRDLSAAVHQGRFREDLLARINLCTFYLPGLRTRSEDIEPNLQFELSQLAKKTGKRVTLSKEARQKFLDFALSSRALWKSNFRDLNAAVARMSTLSLGGRISVDVVKEEIQRLVLSWADTVGAGTDDRLRQWIGVEWLAELDLFDREQLSQVLAVCLRSRSLSEAGRTLFGVSRERETTTNDADRLRKYLSRFGIDWAEITRHGLND